MLGLSFCTAERQVLGKLESEPAGKMSSQLPNRNRDTMGGPSHLKLPQNSADSSSGEFLTEEGDGFTGNTLDCVIQTGSWAQQSSRTVACMQALFR